MPEPGHAHEYAGIAANIDVKTVDDAVLDSFGACHEFALAHQHIAGASHEWQVASNVKLRVIYSTTEREGYFAIVLYHTEIVRYYADKTFSVDNGGYNTPTSSRRITQFTPEGYAFYHNRMKLVIYERIANPTPCDHNRRFQVIHPSKKGE
jgi:hypothetical protein